MIRLPWNTEPPTASNVYLALVDGKRGRFVCELHFVADHYSGKPVWYSTEQDAIADEYAMPLPVLGWIDFDDISTEL